MRKSALDLAIHKGPGISAAKVIRAAIPDASDDLCDYILWERTPYPFDGRPRTIYHCARKFYRSRIPLCELCDGAALPGGLCKSCQRLMDPTMHLATD